MSLDIRRTSRNTFAKNSRPCIKNLYNVDYESTLLSIQNGQINDNVLRKPKDNRKLLALGKFPLSMEECHTIIHILSTLGMVIEGSILTAPLIGEKH